jgi:hypothetical protein
MFFEKKVGGAFFCYMCDKIKKVNKINTSRAFLAVTKLLQAVTNYIKVNKINVFCCYKENSGQKKRLLCVFQKNIHTPFSRL